MTEQQPLLSLIKTLENLLFAIPISEDIVNKYNIIKESAFKKAHTDFTPISKSAYPSIGIKPATRQDGTGDYYAKKVNEIINYTEAYLKDIAKRVSHTLAMVTNTGELHFTCIILISLIRIRPY